ncbi:hypothetical protein BDV12DRAFT_167748 [Aspergillus spectabilis]
MLSKRIQHIKRGVIAPSDINSEAYRLVREIWQRRRLWNKDWWVLPGVAWTHPAPLEKWLKDKMGDEYVISDGKDAMVDQPTKPPHKYRFDDSRPQLYNGIIPMTIASRPRSGERSSGANSGPPALQLSPVNHPTVKGSKKTGGAGGPEEDEEEYERKGSQEQRISRSSTANDCPFEVDEHFGAPPAAKKSSTAKTLLMKFLCVHCAYMETSVSVCFIFLSCPYS